MSTPALVDKARPPRTKRRVGGPGGIRLGQEHSREAQRLAAAILEVLAGARTPAQAAAALSVSLPRYYQLESRGLHALVAACEARPRGRVRNTDVELAALRRQQARLERELARQQALVRLAQRAVGLPAAPALPPAKPGSKKRRRRPQVRALRAAAQLQQPSQEPAPAPSPIEGETPAD